MKQTTKFFLIILGLVFLYLVRDIILMLAVAVVIAAAINPIVDWIKKHHVPRFLAVVLVYLIILGIIGLIISFIFPPLAWEVKQAAVNLPEYLKDIGSKTWPLPFDLEEISQQIAQAASSVLATTINIFGGLASAVIIFIISIYLVVQEEGIRKFITSVTPVKHQGHVLELIGQIQKKMGRWLKGQLLLCAIVGILIFIGLAILKIPYALILAILAGVLEIIPYVGPVIAAVPAIIIGLVHSPLTGLFVFILYVVVQQLENHLIVPQVMKRTVGLNPVVIIIAVLIGAKLAGVMGVILAVPVAAAIAVFAKNIVRIRKESNAG